MDWGVRADKDTVTHVDHSAGLAQFFDDREVLASELNYCSIVVGALRTEAAAPLVIGGFDLCAPRNCSPLDLRPAA